MPNAASLIPTPSAKPTLPKVDYQAPTADASAFAGLLDIGTEDLPPPDRSPPRADDSRPSRRSDSSRDNSTSDRQAAAQKPQDRNADAAPRKDNPTTGTTAANSDKAGSTKDASKAGDSVESKGGSGDADTETAKDGQSQAEASVAAVVTETVLQVVTPVAVSLVIADQAADAAATGETPAVDPVAAATAATAAAEATFSLSAVTDKTVKTTPAQAEAEDAGAKAQAAIAVVAQPAQAPHLKQALKGEETSESAEGDPATTDSPDVEDLLPADHAGILKTAHASPEAKAHRSEHLTESHIDAKATPDTAANTAIANAPPPSHTPASSGLIQVPTATAINGMQAADPRAASEPAADGSVPLAGLAVEITTRAKEGNNRFEIRLDPPELGRIDVRLDIDRQGNVTSRLLVERADTLDLLRRDFSNLERALNDAGLKTDSGSLQFAMRDQGFSDNGQQQNESSRSARVVIPGEAEATPNTAQRYNLSQRSGVDIRV